MKHITIALFCIALFICLIFNISIIFALVAGLVIFAVYGVRSGYSIRKVGEFYLQGVLTVKNILITFLLIGMLTALWRRAGTIAVIVCFAQKLIHPSIFLLMTFLLNCMVSFLTGTSFGTSATMGVICATMGTSLGIPAALTGGAVLSGAFFGDRCSPVSTSALLVATVTKTDIFSNIKGMLKSAFLPFLITCFIYTFAGIMLGKTGDIPDFSTVFGSEFDLSAVAVLPAGLLLLLSLFKVPVKPAMAASILTSIPICTVLQYMPIRDLPGLLLTGYTAYTAEVGALLDGGGISSMLKVSAIVCISSAYSGIFRNTDLLDDIRAYVSGFAQRATSFAAILVTSILASMISCNQTLAIMLTDQLAGAVEPDKDRLAIDLENTAVVVAPLIPWSIAGAVPLAAIGAPTVSITAACYLYLIPICEVIRSVTIKQQSNGHC